VFDHDGFGGVETIPWVVDARDAFIDFFYECGSPMIVFLQQVHAESAQNDRPRHSIERCV